MTSLQLQYPWGDYWNYACPSGPEIDWSYAYQTESRTYDAGTGRISSIAWSAISTPLASSNGGSLQYSWSATQNNGQITQMADTISGETVTYQYDALKRLVSACSSLNNRTTAPTTFQYDGFGNLTSKTLAGVTSAIPVNAGTNQLSNAFYDANGNMTSGAGVTLTYDVANRVRSASPTSGGTEYYGYAADNKRMWRLKSDGATEEWTLYGKSGEKIGVYQWTGLQEQFDNQGNWTGDTAGFTALRTSLWFDGRLMQENGTWVLGDRLGTNRAGGARFLPYGEETTSTANDRVKFATYNRDGFTGLDYADQRYYASYYGRFNTADPYMSSAGPQEPGTWNRYAYTRGDPVNRFDRLGLEDCNAGWGYGCSDGDTDACNTAEDGRCADDSDGGGGGYDTSLDPCAWDPFDAACGFGFLPGQVPGLAGTAGGLGGILIDTAGIFACLTNPLCATAVAGTIVIGSVAIWTLSNSGATTKPVAATGDGATKRGWPPCSPPVGTIGYRLDSVPPSRPHQPFPGDHVHLYKRNQNPLNGQCFWQPIGVTAPPPPAGAVQLP